MAWLHACDLPPRSVISGWHRYCADYIVPACIQWDGPRQLTVRRSGGRARGEGGGQRRRTARETTSSGDDAALYSTGCSTRLVSERASLEQWIVLEDVIVRSLAGLVTSRIVNSSPHRCPMCNVLISRLLIGNTGQIGNFVSSQIPGIYIWFCTIVGAFDVGGGYWKEYMGLWQYVSNTY